MTRIEKTQKIDFNTHPENAECIEIDKRVINIPLKKRSVTGIKVPPRTVDVTLHKIWVDTPFTDNHIKLAPDSKLFSLKTAEIEGVSLNDIKISYLDLDYNKISAHMEYTVLFNPKAITDYTDLSEHKKRTVFYVKRQLNPKSPEETVQEYSVNLEFVKERPDFKCAFTIYEEFKKSFMYYPTGDKIRCGCLNIESRSKYQYAETIQCVIELKLDGEHQNNGLISFGNYEDIDPYLKISDFGVLLKNGQLQISNFSPNRSVKIPVYINFAKIDNPEGIRQINVTADFQYEFGGDKHNETFTEVLKIKGNDALHEKISSDADGEDQKAGGGSKGNKEPSRTKQKRQATVNSELKITIQQIGGDLLSCRNNETTTFSPIQWDKSITNEQICFYLDFENTSKTDKSLVAIKDFEILEIFYRNQPLKLKNMRKSLFTFKSVPNFRLDFKNPRKRFEVYFSHPNIAETPDHLADMELRISCKYHELKSYWKNDKELRTIISNANFDSFYHRVKIRIKENPGANWLGMDIGSSATAAMMGSDIKANALNIDLQKRHEHIQKNHNPGEIEEYGTPFLSSASMLRNRKIKDAFDLQNDLLSLSLSLNDMMSQPDCILPFLRALACLERPEELNPNFIFLNYRLTEKINTFFRYQDYPLTVEDIITGVYRLVIRDYITPEFEQNRFMKPPYKLAIPIPDTFTRHHIDALENMLIAEGQFFDKNREPYSFRSDYITFVDESFATAAYYLAVRSEVETERELSIKKKSNQQSDYVLSYEMGAGGVNLTYFKISDMESGPKVDILGRMSRPTAGNYLDYLIAKIMFESYPDCFNFDFEIDIKQPENIKKVFLLKKIIKNKIKPGLQPDLKLWIKPDEIDGGIKENLEIDPVVILCHDLFQGFIKLNTQDIIKHFFSLFTFFDKKRHKRREYPVDTILFSGRGIQLTDLREKVTSEISDWCAAPDNIVIYEPDQTEMKSMLVKGAAQYAIYTHDQDKWVKFNHRDVLARYGILYKNAQKNGDWDFLELLNPHSDPVFNQTAGAGGDQVKQYIGRGSLNLGAGNIGYITESFSAHTSDDMQAGDIRYLNQRIPFDVNNVGASPRAEASITVECDGYPLCRNQIKATIGAISETISHPLKYEKDPAFKGCLWPYSF